MARKISPYAADIIKTCMTFGFSLGLQLYIIGVLFGGWLDRRLGTAPLFLILGILIAIFLSFYRLIIDFKHATEAEDARNAGRKIEYINYDEVFADEPQEQERDPWDDEDAFWDEADGDTDDTDKDTDKEDTEE